VKPTTIAGFVLLVFGFVALLAGGFTYTKDDKVVDVGPFEATVERRERVSIPPIVGGLAIAAGVVLLFVGSRQRT
jgi:hypothetical protein